MSLTPTTEHSCAHASSNTAQSSKKTNNNYLMTPPVSAQPRTPHTPLSPTEKSTLVNTYVENAAVFLTSIWRPWHPVKSLFSHAPSSSTDVRSYTRFISEILKRSRCSKTALHAALFYVNKLAPQIQKCDNAVLNCPKKVFLTCLILSFKFQYDSTYNLKAWSKISGLAAGELKQLEMGVLKCLDYELGLNNDEYRRWVEKAELFIKALENHSSAALGMSSSDKNELTKFGAEIKDSVSSKKRVRDDDGVRYDFIKRTKVSSN